MQQTETYYTVEQVAVILSRGKDWVWAQCRAQKMPHHKIGRTYRFADADLRELMFQTAVVTKTAEGDDNPVPSKERRRRMI